jgi:hypothetical protein
MESSTTGAIAETIASRAALSRLWVVSAAPITTEIAAMRLKSATARMRRRRACRPRRRASC